jgi:hypothetical protein
MCNGCVGPQETLRLQGERQRPPLAHLGLPAVASSLRAPPDPPVDPAGDHPCEWSNEPFFDDLPVPDPMLG